MNTKTKTYKTLIALVALMTLVVSALPALAKERENERGDGKRVPPGQIRKEMRQDMRSTYLDIWRLYMARLRALGYNYPAWYGWGQGTSTSPDTVAPVINNLRVSAINRNRAIVYWNTNERADSAVFVSGATPVDTQTITPTSNNGQVFVHEIVLNNLNASTTYYIVARSRDIAGNVTTSGTISFTTDPAKTDATAPSITNINGSVTPNTVKINWRTGENATSKVFYSTASAIDVNSSATAFVENTALVRDHSLTVSNLASSTTYYLVVESKDAAGNKSDSAVFIFTTSAVTVPADTVAPVISNIYSVVGGTTMSLNWLTNEAASSKVYYSTTTPVDVNSAANVIDANLVTSHLLQISGLATSTKYYFVLESKDAAGNMVRSGEYYAITAAN